jgi:hypothetical protein
MDGDTTAKTMDRGADSVLRNVEGSDSIHEISHQAVRDFTSFPNLPTAATIR